MKISSSDLQGSLQSGTTSYPGARVAVFHDEELTIPNADVINDSFTSRGTGVIEK
jgi:hypothetical protein